MTLSGAIQAYVDQKRANGVLFDKGVKELRSFLRKVGDVPLETIRPAQISDFLNGPRTYSNTWGKKFSLLKFFFEYWSGRGLLDASPMPPCIHLPVTQTFVPYVYTRNEVRLLLRATSSWQNSSWQNKKMCRMDSQTFSILLLTLFATGMRTGEALNLLRKDVDSKRGVIRIRGGCFRLPRNIPIGPDLRARLRRHERGLAKVSHEPLYSSLAKTVKLSTKMLCGLLSADCAVLRESSGTTRRFISPARKTYERRSRCIASPAGSSRRQTRIG
jgi:integrase/recombinase XerD